MNSQRFRLRSKIIVLSFLKEVVVLGRRGVEILPFFYFYEKYSKLVFEVSPYLFGK